MPLENRLLGDSLELEPQIQIVDIPGEREAIPPPPVPPPPGPNPAPVSPKTSRGLIPIGAREALTWGLLGGFVFGCGALLLLLIREILS